MKRIPLFPSVLFLLAAACTQAPPFNNSPPSPTPSIHASFEVIGDPVVGRDVTLVVTFSSVAGIPYSNPLFDAEVNLPDGIKLVSGDLHFSGDLSKGVSIERRATIRVIEEGFYRISFIDKSVYIDSYSDRATVSGIPPLNGWTGTGGKTTYDLHHKGNISVIFSSPPSLGEDVKLTVTAVPFEALTDARLNILLDRTGISVVSIDSVTKETRESEFTAPPGVDRFSSGQVSWHGDLAANEELAIVLTVRTIKTGSGEVGADLSTPDGKGISDWLSVSVDGHKAEVIDQGLVSQPIPLEE